MDDTPTQRDRYPAATAAEAARRAALAITLTGGEDSPRSLFETWHTPTDLARWLAEPPLSATVWDVDDRALGQARALREAIWGTVHRRTAGEPDDLAAIATINAIAARPPLRPELTVTGAVRWAAGAGVDAALSTVARDAIDLLGGPLASRVRECASPRCALIFVDTSPPGHRRWCAMRRCGNRAKAATHRRHQRVVRGD